MNERERAEIVARAIDALIGGAPADPQPQNEDDELRSLLAVARKRLQGSMFIAKASLQHEQKVWRAVVRRLGENGVGAPRGSFDPADYELEELAEVVAMRRRIAEEDALLAEAHRQVVWEKIQSRLTEKPHHAGIPDILRPFRRHSDNVSNVEARAGPRPYAEPPPIPPAHPRLAMGQMAESAQEMARARVWAKVTSRVDRQSAHVHDTTSGKRARGLTAFALAAAAAAVAAIALGPLPATGFADHPAVRLADAVGEYFGARGGEPPSLAQLPESGSMDGRDATAEEASRLAGVTFGTPEAVPAGFQLVASNFYSQPISGVGTGTFVLIYASDDATIAVYQEAAGGGGDFVVDSESMARVTLSDGTPATLIQGGWSSSDGVLSWSSNAGQTLLFERAGIRVILELRSETPSPGLLFEVASSTP